MALSRNASIQVIRGSGVIGSGDALAGEPSYDTTAERLYMGGTDLDPHLIGGPEYLPKLNLTGVDDADGTGSMTIQLQDGDGASLSSRFLVRTWFGGTTEYAAPSADTDFSVTTGTQIREITADADYEVLADASGTIVMNIDTVTNDTFYVMAEIDGKVYTGSVAITGN